MSSEHRTHRLEVNFNNMRYINLHFTYLLTYTKLRPKQNMLYTLL